MSTARTRAARRRALSSLVVVLAALAAAQASVAKEAVMTAAAEDFSYVRLYTGPDGVSHFAAASLGFVPIGVAGIEAVLSVHRLGDVRGVMLARLKAGATEDWHPAPRRQFMFCLRGLVEVTAGDGERRRIRPGEFVLLEDVTGKGHVTHAIGPDDHVALAIPLESAAQP